MKNKKQAHTLAQPALGFIGWELLLVGGLAGYGLCLSTGAHWLVGVIVAFGVAGLGVAVLAQPGLRMLLFISLALAAGTFVTLVGMIWASTLVSLTVGGVAAAIVYYGHTAAYEVFDIRQKTEQRSRERERYLAVRDEFDRL